MRRIPSISVVPLRTPHAITTAVSESTATFRTERDLQAAIVSHRLELTTIGGPRLLRREMPLGGCIPDFVFVAFSAPAPAAVLRLRWSYRHASVIAQLRSGVPLRRETLAARLYERASGLDRLIADLVAASAIEETDRGGLRLSAVLQDIDTQVVAIEAKLSRWNEALAQAASYRSFADRVFVAMDAGRVNGSASQISRACRTAGIGLIMVTDRDATFVHAGRRRVPRTAQREYVCFSAIGARSQTLWTRL